MKKIDLYHGSDMIIKRPEPEKGKRHNDYGQGFYCTRHIKLAKEWAVDSNRDGYVNHYSFDMSGLKVLDLGSEEFNILNWITILLEHRITRMNGPIAEQGLAYLTSHYHVDLSDADVVIGYRADDSYFSFARAFISNTISVEQLEQAMYLGELGNQYFLRSPKAFSHLFFIDAETVDHSTYYPLKQGRDELARNNYNELTSSIDYSKGTYLIDLIRKG